MTKVMTVVGTRPEIIRLSRVMARLDETVEHVLVHTGQNYDYELNGIFFEEMGIRKPDRFLEVDTSSLGAVLGGVLTKVEQAILEESPDALLVLGDTNSCIAAVMARRMRVPVYHMEAGNRCFDLNVPEETNRRMVDHVSDYNLVYTEHARRNLLAEGMHPRRILLTGSPMKEVLDHHAAQFAASTVLADLGLTRREFLLVSAHREENVDSPARLEALLDCLEAAQRAYDMPMLVSTHPRTRKRLDALVADTGRALPEGVLFHAPLGFVDYVRLQQEALCVLSDSGTISEESSVLGFPAVTLRDSIERPEALDTGAIVMTGLDPQNVVEGIRTVLAGRDDRGDVHPVLPADYAIDNCSQRAVNFILSTHRRHEQWSGIRTP
ncbi:UDP-N-acetylglucosamine 2-epimerase (non-hydrolysing) [Austwickia chelonae]|uniref:Putative UDP-N-acetylglucosamine 2-epimerase n=1 Tax=Austwickia chelonae NBRC 105200 TaxID=1184607 RepID=K6UKW8_9MICO|nr:UDP-N-acetylglucosamine 2-epimerase (non-hydrolyzing) [Austwickia chelonae]GAB76751.1 putative UDP-N-acetylglucosamine 2-epimerase [Austwickia chelonae NBRC 105200]SEW30169.1 UDP-N-acetylglucosamine 2-epimerase (non-hydrolysing) [Austwickia chelonae]